MSDDATTPSNAASASAQSAPGNGGSPDKGKGKFVPPDATEEDEEDDEEEEEEDDEEEDDGMEVDDDFEEINPAAIRPRRTRGVRVDYTSEEALKKAGLKPEAADDDEEEESFVARDDDMRDD